MTRLLPALSLAVVMALPAAAFDGVVRDEAGRPVAGARVTVAGLPGTVVADGEGRFRLEPGPEPPFVLVVARADGVAFSPVTVTALPADGPLVVTVKPLGDTITVLSGAPPDLEVPPAAAAAVLGRKEIEDRVPGDLAQALEGLPGASVSGVGPAEIPALRGLSKGRTLLILDGGRLVAERRAGPSATFLDPETVEEIEVVRGPGSVAYGSDAFGGVVRARSRMPDPGAPLRLRWAVLGATAAGEAGAAAEVTAPALGGGVLVGGHVRDQGDVHTPRGTVPDSGARRRGFRLAWQRPLGAGVLQVGWRTDLARDVGKPRPDPGSTRRFYPREDSHRLSLGYERPGPGSWDRLSAAFTWDSYRLVLNKDRRDGAEVVSRSQADVDARDWELRIEGERALGRARLVLGVNGYGRYGLEAVNRSFQRDGGLLRQVSSERAVDGASSVDGGLFAGVSSTAGPLRLSGGLRVDAVRVRSGGGHFGSRSLSHGALSGFAAAGMPVGRGFDLTVQVARGFRDARLSDRFYRGESGRGFITGNPDLEPETSRQADLALRWSRGGAEVAVYGYLYRIRHLIERYREGDDYFFRNRGEAELRGLELEASLPLGTGTALRLGAWAEHGEIRGAGDPVDDVPAPGAFVGLRARCGELGWWFVHGRAWARATRPGPSERVVPGAAVLDAGAGLRLGGRLELRVAVRNLLDRTYLPSADENAVPAPGRSLVVRLSGTF